MWHGLAQGSASRKGDLVLGKVLSHVRANGVAYTALFVALSGTAVATTSALPANSVGTTQLKNGAVTGQKVAQSTLTGANIRSSTLGTVPNAAHLGRLAPSAYQHRIGQACAGGHAITAVSAAGKPSCGSFGQGTITSVTGTTGLSGSATSGAATLSVDPAVVQSRVTGTCSSSNAVSGIGQDGSVTCQSTNVTEMMGGSGGASFPVPGGGSLVPFGVSTPTVSNGQREVGTTVPSTAKDLTVHVGTAPTSGTDWVFGFMVNGSVEQTFTCTVTAGNNSCTSTGSLALAAGDTLALYGIPENGPSPTTATFAWLNVT